MNSRGFFRRVQGGGKGEKKKKKSPAAIVAAERYVCPPPPTLPSTVWSCSLLLLACLQKLKPELPSARGQHSSTVAHRSSSSSSSLWAPGLKLCSHQVSRSTRRPPTLWFSNQDRRAAVRPRPAYARISVSQLSFCWTAQSPPPLHSPPTRAPGSGRAGGLTAESRRPLCEERQQAAMEHDLSTLRPSANRGSECPLLRSGELERAGACGETPAGNPGESSCSRCRRNESRITESSRSVKMWERSRWRGDGEKVDGA